MNHLNLLKSFGSCEDAVEWYNGQDSKTAWNTCERGDWMLWIASKLGVDKPSIVRAACDCAELTIHLIPVTESRSRIAIQAARDWANNPCEETIAYHAAKAAKAAYYAAKAAYYAAKAAEAAYYAADYAADAAYYAADYAADAARKNTLQKCANIVRSNISWNTVLNTIENRRESVS